MDHRKLKAELERDEGLRLKPYQDTVGKLTIGVGRNLDDVGISKAEADFLLRADIERAEFDARLLVSCFEQLTDARQRVLVNMAFNLGRPRLGKFRKFLAAVAAGDWHTAAREMLDSAWAEQVGDRATRLARMMREG